MFKILLKTTLCALSKFTVTEQLAAASHREPPYAETKEIRQSNIIDLSYYFLR